jgi:hypothetical protein
MLAPSETPNGIEPLGEILSREDGDVGISLLGDMMIIH